MESIEPRQLIGFLCHLSEVFETQKDYLTTLDSEIGDGDMGVTMTLGFRAIRDQGPKWPPTISEILRQCGLIFGNVAPSTFGTLLATGFLKASSVVGDKEIFDSTDILNMLEAAISGIQSRGKAELGNKTMLDALVPAAKEGSRIILLTKQMDVFLDGIAGAAEFGAESTRNMIAVMGRSRWLQERSIGHLDPGAVTVSIILREGSTYFSSRKEESVHSSDSE
jgi:dihydroxyacetone kinase-like protein